MFSKLIRKLLLWYNQKHPKKRKAPRVDSPSLGLSKDPFDERDEEYSFATPISEEILPDVCEIPLEFHSPLKDQSRIGSCASHSAADLVEMEYALNKIERILPLSELWHYYVVRSPEFMNVPGQDSGQDFRSMCKVLAQKGIAPEVLCPYDVTKFNDKPTYWADMFASYYKILSYHRVTSVADIAKVIYLNHPIALGVYVTPAFMRHRGKEAIQPANDDRMLGGHAIVLLGYDLPNRRYKIKNSWGSGWGDNGYAWVSESYLLKYCIDMWHVKVV